jgi:hypothetical protein
MKNWRIIDFGSILGQNVSNPKTFFQPFEYLSESFFTPPNNTLDARYRNLAVVWRSFVDDKPWSIDYSSFDAVLIVDYEFATQPLTEYVEKLKKLHKNSNLLYIVSDTLRGDTHPDCKIHPWFLTTAAKLNSYTPVEIWDRPKIFDALLGLNKAHRQYVFDQLVAHNLLERSYVSILKSHQGPWSDNHRENSTLYRSPDLDHLETVEAKQAIIDTGFFNSYCQTFNVRGNKRNVSAQIPPAIYNNSYYSLICETHDHDWFLSEKTAKPLIAQRPFIMFGGQHHLAFLRQLGFHTFDQIIDESYDSEPNKFLRHKQAFAQAIELSKMNPRHVYDVLSDALEHNRRLINSDDLMIPVKDWLFNKLADF